MFEWLTVEAIMEQARPLAAWLTAYQAEMRASAWQELWVSVPWWFRLIMLAYVVVGIATAVRRLARRAGVRI